MQWPSNYRGWDDRRLPVRLAPTPWAWWVSRGGIALSILVPVAVLSAALTHVPVRTIWIMPVFVLLMIAMGQVGQRERFDRLVPTRLGRGQCPQCFYQLGNVPREDDNATVCPECGAAWVLPGKKG